MKSLNQEILKDYWEKLKSYREKEYIDPITTVVAMLPKHELASMAESLVSITSFKRKIGRGSETVGGPIDVAVISKGDGFVWVKRKQYFTTELNPQYISQIQKELGDE